MKAHLLNNISDVGSGEHQVPKSTYQPAILFLAVEIDLSSHPHLTVDEVIHVTLSFKGTSLVEIS
jgi:hypothetical protein